MLLLEQYCYTAVNCIAVKCTADKYTAVNCIAVKCIAEKYIAYIVQGAVKLHNGAVHCMYCR